MYKQNLKEKSKAQKLINRNLGHFAPAFITSGHPVIIIF